MRSQWMLTYSDSPATRSNQASAVDPHFPKMKTAPLISLGVLCYYGCTITLDNQYMSVHNNGQKINKGIRNKKTGMWELNLETQKSEAAKKKLMAQTSKPELSQ